MYLLNSKPAVRERASTDTTPAVVASDFKFAGSNERAIASNGEVNAHSRKDLIATNLALVDAVRNRRVISSAEAELQERTRANASAHMELLTAAMNGNTVAHRQVAEAMGHEIYMTSTRKGVARRFLNHIPLRQGDRGPSFPVRSKNATATYITGDGRVETQILTDKYYNPPEGFIQARLFISQQEINQSSTNVLDEKIVEGMEAVMVSEDRFFRRLAQETVGLANDQTVVAGSLSPAALMQVRQRVLQWGIPVAYCYMASDLFTDIVSDPGFSSVLDPVTKHELVLTGEIATLFGMSLISEGYRHVEHQVLNAGEFIAIAAPDFLGAYSDRGGVISKPLDVTTENVLGIGIHLAESFTAAIGNARGIAMARRI